MAKLDKTARKRRDMPAVPTGDGMPILPGRRGAGPAAPIRTARRPFPLQWGDGAATLITDPAFGEAALNSPS